jgi:hypothetical protein
MEINKERIVSVSQSYKGGMLHAYNQAKRRLRVAVQRIPDRNETVPKTAGRVGGPRVVPKIPLVHMF